jgi:hypothetical protein
VIGRRLIGLALGLAVGLGSARADEKGAKRAPKAAAPAPAAVEPAKKTKVKTYDFGGLDIDGRLRTPQLLYFLNRMKSEFDTTTPDKKSFLPELQKSGDEL